ncbi:GLYL3 protein, partial [Oxyruncus cristatus]|nr:GLYL3 protein [Oxyruncus cristatus]
MQVLTSPAQLQRLEGILKKSLPLALPVYGAVLNITRGNPGQFEVLVDKWPDFGAALARASRLDWGALGGPGGRNWGAGHTEDTVQGDVGSIVVGFGGLRSAVVGLTGAGGHWEARWPDPSVRLGSLLPSHVDLLNETWPYGGNARSRRYLAELLGRFPHVCLQDSAGEPLSWVLTDHFGTGTHSFTLPAHRRRGHMQVALTVAAQRAQARGFPTFG